MTLLPSSVSVPKTIGNTLFLMVATRRLRTAVLEGAYKQPSCRMRAAGYRRMLRKRWLHLSFQRLP